MRNLNRRGTRAVAKAIKAAGSSPRFVGLWAIATAASEPEATNIHSPIASLLEACIPRQNSREAAVTKNTENVSVCADCANNPSGMLHSSRESRAPPEQRPLADLADSQDEVSHCNGADLLKDGQHEHSMRRVRQHHDAIKNQWIGGRDDAVKRLVDEPRIETVPHELRRIGKVQSAVGKQFRKRD